MTWSSREQRKISKVINSAISQIMAKLGKEFEVEVKASFEDYPAWVEIKIKRYER